MVDMNRDEKVAVYMDELVEVSTVKTVKNVHSEFWQLGNKLHGATSQINTNPHDNVKSVTLIAIPHLTSTHIHHDDVNDCQTLSALEYWNCYKYSHVTS
jgi:hypothetical protein